MKNRMRRKMQRARPASEETKNWNLDDESRNGGGHEELEGQDDVDLADERPSQVRVLHHPAPPCRRSAGPAPTKVSVGENFGAGSSYDVENGPPV